LPEWWPEQETLRCLHASNWDYQKTFTDINIIINWRATNLPIKLDDIHARLLRSGFFTVHGRDKFLRPVMIMRPLVLLREGFLDAEIIKPVACFCHFYIVNYLHRSGQIENNLFLFDLENASPFGLPIKMMAAVEDTMKAQFKCVTCKIFVLNCSKMFVYGWAAVRGLIDPLVAQKITLVGANTCDELKALVPSDQLLEEFGGSAKRPEKSWPPTIPNT